MCVDECVVYCGHGAGGLAPEGDAIGIAAEGADVLGNPTQGKTLVFQAEVGCAGCGDLIASEEAESALAVVGLDDNDRAASKSMIVFFPAARDGGRVDKMTLNLWVCWLDKAAKDSRQDAER